MESPIEVFRRECLESDTARDAGLTTPEDIKRFDNICYGESKSEQILDVYRPLGCAGKKLPVIVSVHGGGWVYGNKEIYQFYCMNLAQRGFAVVNFTYRLAPEHKYPAPMEDTNLVFGWVLANADKFGFDTDRIFAVGDSAGAQNIGLYSCILTNPAYAAEYETLYGLKAPAGLSLKAIGLNCGVYYVDPDGPAGFLEGLLPEKGTHDELLRMSIVDHITPAFPPCYIFTANEDFLKDAPALLMKVLDENKVTYDYKLYGDETNPLKHVFHCDVKTVFAKEANDDECNFFKKYC